MYVKYGSYEHAANESSVQFSHRVNRSRLGYRETVTKTIVIRGKIHGTDPEDVNTNLAALLSAYAADGEDFGLYIEDESEDIVTVHFLDNDSSISGVQVEAVEFPEAVNAEFTTYRSYQITATAVYLAAEDGLLEFTETVSFTGTGGPRHVFLETATGPVVKQTVNQNTVYTASQSGSAVGMTSYPTPPAPLWPDDEDVTQRRITTISPTIMGEGNMRYPISWSYNFVSGSSLSGTPNTGPGE